jgi:hypothetical protein
LEESKREISERKITEAVEREERRAKKRNKPQETQPQNTDYSFYIKQFKEKGKKKVVEDNKDAQAVEQLTEKLTVCSILHC